MGKKIGKQYGKSIRAEVHEAKTVDEVNQVLLKVTTLKKASLGTIRRIDRAARAKLDALAASAAQTNA